MAPTNGGHALGMGGHKKTRRLEARNVDRGEETLKGEYWQVGRHWQGRASLLPLPLLPAQECRTAASCSGQRAMVLLCEAARAVLPRAPQGRLREACKAMTQSHENPTFPSKADAESAAALEPEGG